MSRGVKWQIKITMNRSCGIKLIGALLILTTIGSYSCSTSKKMEIIGAWRSNRELTVQTFEKSQTLPDKYKEILYAPDFFGSLIYIYYENEAITIYEGQCSKTPYRVVKEGKNYVDIEAYDSFFKKNVINRVYIEDELMWLQFKEPFREIFTRVEISKLVEEYECIKPLIPR